MPQRAATIKSLPAAFEVVKAMQAQGLDWGEGYRPFGRLALAEIIETEMAAAVDRWLERLEAEDDADRRNGYYRRSLLTELGDIELFVPRTRRYCPTEVVRAYARRSPEIDRTILAGFVLGLSTRKLGEVLLCLLGRPVSPTTVSRVAQDLRQGGRSLPRPPPQGALPKALMLDGVVLAPTRGWSFRQSGAGGFGPAAGRQEGGHRLSPGARRKRRRMGALPRRPLQARPHWRRPRHDLRRRRLGLLAALPMVSTKRRSSAVGARKIRNILNKVRKADEPLVKADLHAVMNADAASKARSASQSRFAERWRKAYPAAVACLRDDLDELLTCFRYKTLAARKAVRTTNAIERRFREVRRRPAPWASFRTEPPSIDPLRRPYPRKRNAGNPDPLGLTHGRCGNVSPPVGAVRDFSKLYAWQRAASNTDS